MRMCKGWLARLCSAVFTLACLLLTVGAASAQQTRCANPVAACGATLTGPCLGALGDSSNDESGVSCASEFNAYRACLVEVAGKCGRNGGLVFPEAEAFRGRDPRFLLSSDGLGAISRQTVVTLRDLRAYYPELEFKIERFFAEGAAYSRIVGSRAKRVLLTIELEKARLSNLIVYSERVVDENGATVGLQLADLPIGDTSSCFNGADDFGHIVMCPSPDQGDPAKGLIQYLFLDTTPAELTSSATLDAIRLYFLP